MYIILAILISLKSNKIAMYIMRQIKKLTWLQACFLGDMRVIWCNSSGDSYFQTYVINFVEIVIGHYLLITSHVSQVFASCTRYTSYSLLNLVHYIVCDLVVPSKIKSLLILMQNMFTIWELGTNWLKIVFLDDLG